ncbi:MAG: PQQ-binding-like beta-propeller repeat protein [Jatrophihabitantaceae bacterium]
MTIERYNSAMRRWRIAYAAAIVVVLIAVGIVVKIAYNHGEISHAKLVIVATAPPSVAAQTPAPTITRAWTSTDHTAIGLPYWRGTVVTYNADSVRGRNADTGAITWSYTRDDRTVCTAAQIGGITVTIFELDGNCNEATAVDSETGARKWTRTLDKDGQPLFGHPAYQIGQYTLMMTTPTVIYAVDPSSGLDRWVFGQRGCTINSAVLGTAGALISQNCTAPDCASDAKFCGTGQQLLLRDATTGESDDTVGNHDQLKWNLVGSTLRPAAADQVVAAIDSGADTLTTLDSAKGKTLATIALKKPAGDTLSATATSRGELIWTGGVTYAVPTTGSAYLWTAPTIAAPTIISITTDQTPDLSSAIIAAPGTNGIELLSGTDGQVVRTIAAPSPAADSTSYPFGTGFILAGSTTTLYR